MISVSLKAVLKGNIGSEETESTLKPVVVTPDDQTLIAFEVDRKEGGFVAVYLPDTPNPATGSLFYVIEERVKELNISTKDALQGYQKLGRGSAKIL